MTVGRAAKAVMLLAALTVVCAGAKLAASIIVPLLLAAFVATVTAPLVTWLSERGLPRLLAVALSTLTTATALTGLGALVGSALTDASRRLPEYQTALVKTMDELALLGARYGVRLSAEEVSELRGSLMSLATSALTGLAGLLSDFVLVLILVVFMLLESGRLGLKLTRVVKSTEGLVRFRAALADFNKYLAVKTLMSLVTGVLVGVWCWALDVDLAILWGTIAFVLNFIPAIGSVIAALPAIFVALLDLGTGTAVGVALGYLVINFAIGNFLEPRIMGRALGLSPLVILLSVLLWGWLLGPVGALLSSLLTMILKLFLLSTEDARWIAIMMAPAQELEEAGPQSIGARAMAEFPIVEAPPATDRSPVAPPDDDPPPASEERSTGESSAPADAARMKSKPPQPEAGR